MARRAPPMDPAPQAPDAAIPGAPMVPGPTLPGGSSGILPSGANLIGEASRKIHFGHSESFAARSEPVGDPPKVMRYVVQNCPKPPHGTHGFRVVMNGVLAFLPDGKLVDSTMYDVDALRRQGVDLKEIGEV